MSQPERKHLYTDVLPDFPVEKKTLFFDTNCRKYSGKEINEKVLQTLLDSAPFGCILFDNKLQIIDCNQVAIYLYGFSEKQEFLKNFFDSIPEFQTNGKYSVLVLMTQFEKVLKTGNTIFYWNHYSKLREEILLEITMVRISLDNCFFIAAYIRDLSNELIKSGEEEYGKYSLLTLDTLPMVSFIISRQHKFVDCNQETILMFNAKSKEDLINSSLEDFSLKYQPDGQLSTDKITKMINKAVNDGYVSFEWSVRLAVGNIIPVEIVFVYLRWRENKNLIYAYAWDLCQEKEVENELLQKSTMLNTINKIAERLLLTSPSGIDKALQISMKDLAQSVCADTVRIWKNVEIDGKSFYYLLQSWPEKLEIKKGELKSYDNVSFWKDAVFNNCVVNSLVSELPERERKALDSCGIKSVLFMPLIIDNQVWGFISFDDYQNSRRFTEFEKNALRSGSTMIASAIRQNAATKELMEINKELVKNRNLLSAINSVAELILSSEKKDFQVVIQKSLKIIGEAVGADRAAIWKNYLEKDVVRYASKLPGWRRGESFEKSKESVKINLYNYIPEWQDSNDIKDLEFTVNEMNENLKKLTVLQGEKLLLLIPLFLQEKFWGIAAFAQKTERRCFGKEEREMIRSGSLMIAESIMRNEISDNLFKVETIASTDALTGLMNRLSFIPMAEAMFEASRQAGKYASIMFLDIDHFKKVNDTYGHGFGDNVLVRFADVLKKSIRPGDLCTRYGGEEFIIMLTDGKKRDAVKVAKRIINTLKTIRFSKHPEFTFTISIGIISSEPQNGETVQTYIDKADIALYKAKELGRGRLVFFAEAE